MPAASAAQLKRFKWTAIAGVVLGAVLLLLPYGIQFGLQKLWLSQGADKVAVADIDFNPFTGRLAIHELHVSQKDTTVLSIEHLSLNVRLRDLWRKRLFLEQIQLHNSFILTLQSNPQNLNIGGINVPLQPKDKTEETSGSLPLLLGIRSIDLSEVTLALLRPQQAVQRTTYTLRQLTLNDLYMWEAAPAELKFSSYLNQSRINSHFHLHLFSPDPKIVGTVRVNQLILQQLPFLAELPEVHVSGDLTADLTFTAQLFPQGLNFQQQGRLRLNRAVLESAPYEAQWESLDWSGDFSYIEGEDHPRVILNGQLNLAGLEAQDPVQQSRIAGHLNAQWTLLAQLKPDATTVDQQGQITLTDLLLMQPDREATTEKAQWQGTLGYHSDPAQPDHADIKAVGSLTAQALNLNQNEPLLQMRHDLDAQIDLTLTTQPQGLRLMQNGDITARAIQFQQPPFQLSLEEALWQGNLRFESDKAAEDPDTKIHSQGTLNLLAIDFQDNDSGLKLQHNAQAQVDLNLQLLPQEMHLQQTGGVQLSNLQFSQPSFAGQLHNLDWQGKVSLQTHATEEEHAVAEKADHGVKIDSAGSLALTGLHTQSQTHATPLLDLQSLDIGQIKLQQLQAIELSALQLKGLGIALPEPSSKTQSGLLFVQQANLDRLQLSDLHQVQLGSLILKDSQTHLTLSEDGQVEQLQALLAALKPASEKAEAPAQQNDEEPPAAQEVADAKPFDFQWQTIQTQGEHRIALTTRQFASPISKQFHLSKLNIGALNSQAPERDTAYELELTLDEFAKVHSKGTVQPLNPLVTANLKTDLEGINLVDLSPLSAQFIGYEIASGQLSAELNTQIKANQIDAQNDLRIHKIKLQSADTSKSADFEKGLSMPLDAALSLLRDKNDNIRLQLPISGDLANPQFDIQDVINTALAGALKTASRTYLLLALQPFGAIALAGEALTGQIQAVRLQPIDFDAGQTTLSKTMQDYLGKVNTLLGERKGVQIKVCGLANEADRNALLAALATSAQTKPAADQSVKKPADLVNDAQLMALADERGKTIKRFLLTLGTSTDQVILCQPKLSDANHPPQVEMGI